MNASIDNSVVVIDPDASSREESAGRFQEAGFSTCACSNAQEFLQQLRRLETSCYFCVVSELSMGSMPAPHFLQHLASSRHTASVVFYVNEARIRDVVRVMRGGAIAVVEKSDGVQGVLRYVEEGLEDCRAEFLAVRDCSKTLGQLRQLTAGEKAVLRGIMSGKLNKEIAQDVSLSMRTIEQRRRAIFRKLEVDHPAPLACKVMQVAHASQSQLDLHPDEPGIWLGERRLDAPGLFTGRRIHAATREPN